jgi:hypothetical protein
VQDSTSKKLLVDQPRQENTYTFLHDRLDQPRKETTEYKSIQSARLSLQSSESAPLAPSPARECCPPPFGTRGDNTRLRGKGGGGGFNSDEGQIVWYSRYSIIDNPYTKSLFASVLKSVISAAPSGSNKGLQIVRHCLEWNFYRTPAGYTAKKKTRRKRNRGYQGLLSVAQQTSPSPSPSPPIHTARLLRCLGLRYQDISPPFS